MEKSKKMSIIIDEKHAAKIEDALQFGQGKARERFIASYDELVSYMQDALDKIPSIPKKHFDKCVLDIFVGAGHFPNSYKYIPLGTHVRIIFGQDGKGRLTYVSRENVNGKKQYRFSFTDIAKTSVLAQLNIF